MAYEKLNDDISYDKERDVYSVCGVLYEGSLFRDLGKTLPVGGTFRVVSREPDGALAIGKVD